jgi:hypothetical protein
VSEEFFGEIEIVDAAFDDIGSNVDLKIVAAFYGGPGFIGWLGGLHVASREYNNAPIRPVGASRRMN